MVAANIVQMCTHTHVHTHTHTHTQTLLNKSLKKSRDFSEPKWFGTKMKCHKVLRGNHGFFHSNMRYLKGRYASLCPSPTLNQMVSQINEAICYIMGKREQECAR